MWEQTASAQLCVARWKANSSTTHSTHSHTCLLARMSSTHEILCSQQEDRPRDALPCCKDYAGSVCRCQCDLRHHTYNTQDPCRHSCHSFRCSHRSTGHYFRLPLVAPPCPVALESFRAEVLRAVVVHAITVFALFWSAPILSATHGVVPVT